MVVEKRKSTNIVMNRDENGTSQLDEVKAYVNNTVRYYYK